VSPRAVRQASEFDAQGWEFFALDCLDNLNGSVDTRRQLSAEDRKHAIAVSKQERRASVIRLGRRAAPFDGPAPK
jgi:hypothetical protein